MPWSIARGVPGIRGSENARLVGQRKLSLTADT
jgi:hypothetical protein